MTNQKEFPFAKDANTFPNSRVTSDLYNSVRLLRGFKLRSWFDRLDVVIGGLNTETCQMLGTKLKELMNEDEIIALRAFLFCVDISDTIDSSDGY